MSHTRKSSLFQDLFGNDVPLWRKLLTLVTFPIWGPLAAVLFLGIMLGGLVVFSLSLAFEVIDNISGR